MKNRHIIVAGLMVLFGLASCDKYLDHLPDNRLELNTPEKVAQLLTTSYALSSPMMLLELSSDNVTDNGANFNAQYVQAPETYLFQDNSTTSSDTPHSLWNAYYKAISTANSALAACGELEDAGHDMSSHRAEALISRAWSHFVLVNVFCQAYHPEKSETDMGIPYITGPGESIFQKYPRGTVKEVWDKINQDIEAALPHIDDRFYAVPKNHFNRKAAYCFAAEFNLYYGNPDKAIEYANVVLGADPASLMRDMTYLKGAPSGEQTYWRYIEFDHKCNLMLLYCGSSRWGRIQVGGSSHYRYALSNVINSTGIKSPGPWSGQDEGGRFASTSLSLLPSYTYNSVVINYNKLRAIETVNDDGSYSLNMVWIPFTTEKALLTRAEAYVMKELYDDATDDLLLWYNNHNDTPLELSTEDICEFYKGKTITTEGGPVYTGAELGKTKFAFTEPSFAVKDGNQNYMMQAVLHARRMEFIHEGWRLLDLKRFGIAFSHEVYRGDPIEIKAWDKRLAIQLPYMVLAAGMEPNPR